MVTAVVALDVTVMATVAGVLGIVFCVHTLMGGSFAIRFS